MMIEVIIDLFIKIVAMVIEFIVGLLYLILDANMLLNGRFKGPEIIIKILGCFRYDDRNHRRIVYGDCRYDDRNHHRLVYDDRNHHRFVMKIADHHRANCLGENRDKNPMMISRENHHTNPVMISL